MHSLDATNSCSPRHPAEHEAAKPSGVFWCALDHAMFCPAFPSFNKWHLRSAGRRCCAKSLTTWLLKMMSLPGARKMRKPGSLKDNVWLSFSIQLDVLASFFLGTRSMHYQRKQPDSLQRIEALVSDFMVGSVGFLSWWFDFWFFQWCGACLFPLPQVTQMNLYLIRWWYSVLALATPFNTLFWYLWCFVHVWRSLDSRWPCRMTDSTRSRTTGSQASLGNQGKDEFLKYISKWCNRWVFVQVITRWCNRYAVPRPGPPQNWFSDDVVPTVPPPPVLPAIVTQQDPSGRVLKKEGEWSMEPEILNDWWSEVSMFMILKCDLGAWRGEGGLPLIPSSRHGLDGLWQWGHKELWFLGGEFARSARGNAPERLCGSSFSYFLQTVK